MHTGTHIDMPSHMLSDDRLAAAFKPEMFIGRGVLLMSEIKTRLA